jgi:proline iminopeptidase
VHLNLERGRHTATINGSRLAYHVHGDGPLLFAVPGGPGLSHTYLRAPLLEREVTVVYLDPIGCGDSAELDDPSQYGRARDVADLDALREHLGQDRIALLGHSAGGFTAQEYALGHPDRVRRLVLFGTAPTNGPEYEASLDAEMQARAAEPWYPAAARAMDEIFARDLNAAEAHELGKAIWPLYCYEGEGALSARLGEIARLNPARAKLAPHVAFDFRQALRSLSIPTLIVAGVRDFISPPAMAKVLHAAIAGSRLVSMERSGHLAHLEEPEAFASAIEAFLKTGGQ